MGNDVQQDNHQNNLELKGYETLLFFFLIAFDLTKKLGLCLGQALGLNRPELDCL